jgi:polar amino acid transport system substrate-binding protein
LDPVQPEPVLRAGYNRAFRPFAVEKNGAAAGLAIDRTRATLAGAGLAATFLPLDLPEMIDRLLAGDIDLLAGVGVSPARAGQLAFSRPLVATGGAWFPRADAGWPADGALRAGAGGRLRVVTPAAGPLAAHIAARFPQLSLTTCSDYQAALSLVAGGEADAAALNFHVGRELIAGDSRFAPPDDVFLGVDLAIAVPAGDPQGLLDRLDPHVPPPG